MTSSKCNARDRHPEMVPIAKIKPNPHNARTHSKKQIRQIADSIVAFGVTAPVIIDEEGVLLAGHGRWEAAKLLGHESLLAIVISGLSDAKKRALLLADNRIAQNAGWDREQLATEIPSLHEMLLPENLDISITGFETAEVDALLADFEADAHDPTDDIDHAHLAGPAVTRPDDLWRLHKHFLLCGDARSPAAINRLMGEDRAHMAFLDPPYNVSVQSVVGRGRVKHGEFAMASGEMSREAFTAFLTEVTRLGRTGFNRRCGPLRIYGLASHQRAYIGWAPTLRDMLNLVTWVKTNAGQGSFYRSQHELIGVFRVGNGPHLNTIELGKHGRSRSNVWRYPGANTFRSGRMHDLRAHPTVKPTAMIADAMKDCTRRDHIVLDTFCGSGTTILAAERVGRCARALEIDPHYVDVAIRRWQAFTGRDAIHSDSGLTFDATALHTPSPTDR